MPMSPRLLRPRQRATSTALPLTISGLGLWLDFSKGSTLAQNSDGTTAAIAADDPIGYVADLSGNSRHFSQSTNNNRPLLKLSAQNGLNAAYFDGTDDILNGSTAARGTLRNVAGATSFVARKMEVPASVVWQKDIEFSKGSSASIRFNTGLQSTTTASNVRAITAVANADAGGDGNVRYAVSSAAVTAAWHEWLISNCRVNYNSTEAGAISYRFNNGTAYTGTMDVAANTSDTDSSAVVLGQSMKGWIGEVLVYNRRLTDSERTTLMDYLAAKWGITL